MNELVELKILSHACMLAKFGRTSVLVDPWLLGSCYWRSWWNFPVAQFDEEEIRRVDAVIISHVHWDHWHGPTIRKYLMDRPFIVPDEPNTRSYDDLKRFGIKNITRLRHAQVFEVGPGLSVSLHQFGLFLNDAAVVLQLGNVRILNANDAKIGGWPLRAIVDKHGPFDFALRSHSSANARACFRIEGTTEHQDDDMHYARSFKLFMDAVQPRYAIPFASNHCHLHGETSRFNRQLTNPLKLKQQLATLGGLERSQLTVLPPGSGWRSDSGFSVASLKPFEDPATYIKDYAARQATSLLNNEKDEQRIQIGDVILKKLSAHVLSAPALKRKMIRPATIGLELFWPDGRCRYFVLNIHDGSIVECDVHETANWRAGMRWPAAVFRDVVAKRMYSHGLISKRFEFVAKDAASLHAMIEAYGILGMVELGVYPLRASYLRRFILGYLARWRELPVYLRAAYLILVRKQPGYVAEELILKATRPSARTFTAATADEK